MIRVALIAVLIVACDRRAPEQHTPVVGSADVIPDVTTIDWRNQTYELASLGTVTAKDGRAEFLLVEDASGEVHAEQGSAARGTAGSLVLAPAHYADLDGDGHDEAIIPFVLRSLHADDTQTVFGAFAYTLREGLPLRLAVVTAEAPFDVDGTVLVSGERRWRWTAGRYVEGS